MSQKTNMPEFIRSECPHCHTQYKVSLAQLAAGKNKARCGACGTTFLITDNLADTPSQKESQLTNARQQPQPVATKPTNSNVSPAETTSATKKTAKVAASKKDSRRNKRIDDTRIDDDLIYDDMVDDSEEASESRHGGAFDADFGDDWLFNDDLTMAAQTPKGHAFDALADNDEPISNDAWIEELLAKEGLDDAYVNDPFMDDVSADHVEQPESFTAPKTNSNLSSLLDELGVQTATAQPQAPKKAAPINKLPNARLLKRNRASSMAMPNFSAFKTSVVTPFFWLLGCIALMLLLLAQYVVFNLDALIKQPNQRLRLQEFCSMVNCALPDADISQLVITNQQHLPSTSVAHATDIMAAIGNQSSQSQLFPNIKVRLYQGNQLIGEFIAEPDEYLVTPQRLMGSSQVNLLMLTVNIDPSTITKVDITPFY